MALVAMPANAQSPNQSTTAEDEAPVVVVTGSILRQTDKQLASPVTTVSAESLDSRGISTVQDGLQSLAANNGPALTNSFSANGAFAAGASAVSLRGLSTNSTLVLFDGLRAAYYPLADDGSRNFVDLNTIPDDIVERVEILRDGASSAYGADAIAGVVNIITKREFQGVSARAETGLSSRVDAASHRLSATVGVGSLNVDGYNAYVSGFYYQSDMLKNSERPYPYNSLDLRGVCFEGNCGGNGVLNGLDENGVFTALSTAANFMVRPYNAANTTAAAGRYQNLAGCGPGTRYNMKAADLAVSTTAPADYVCQYDYANLYYVIQPEVERWGVSAKFTARLGDTMEAYTEFNFMQSRVEYTGSPPVIRGNAPTGIYYPQFSTSDGSAVRAAGSGILALPIYVCSRAQGQSAVMVAGVPQIAGCSAANGKLNPNNPYAAAGQVARIIGRDVTSVTESETRNRAYRAAFGVQGDISDSWTFDLSGTLMHVDLRRRQDGYAHIQHLLDVIADGSYNFINPAANSQAVLDYLYPTNIVNASSDQYQVQLTFGTSLFELPGGTAQLGFGGSLRYEAVDAPSGNSDINGPTQRYFSLNAFGTTGSRSIHSGYAEVQLPVLDMLDVEASGRYDSYSSGQDAFSPKVGFKFRPMQSLLLRGTWSKGFRIPAFGEANALPTTGYVSNNVSLFNDTYLAQYGCTTANFATACPTYIRSGSYGQTTLASPDLEPEKSRSFTLGAFFEPIRNVSFAVDYYNIKKTGAITTKSNSPALLAYYTGAAIPAGYNVIADSPDPNFPNAKPRVAFVQSSLINANTIKSEGLDFAINSTYRVTPSVTWTSNLEASVILKLSTEFPDGTVERYDGTLGNFNLTAGSGTPKWHGTWVNGLGVNDWTFTSTVNYFGGYDLSAMDQGTDYKDCGLSDGTTPCRVKSYITFDLNVSLKIADKLTLYGTVLNIADRMPPVDVVTYGATHYNPVQGGTGILGRYFKIGAKVKI